MATTPRDIHAPGDSGALDREDDAVLLARVAAERMDAFEALYRRYHPRLAHFLQRMTRCRSLVDEILDDTMLVVWHKAHTFNPGGKVSTWIFGIAYRQALKAVRRLDEAVEFDPDRHGQPSLDAPDALVQQQQQRQHIERALADLSAEHRAVIEMTYFLGYSCRDIAQVMDCPVETVKTRMFYARRRLRGALGEDREVAP